MSHDPAKLGELVLTEEDIKDELSIIMKMYGKNRALLLEWGDDKLKSTRLEADWAIIAAMNDLN